MDMNAILDQWDKIQKKEKVAKNDIKSSSKQHLTTKTSVTSSKKNNEQEKIEKQIKKQNERKVSDMERWLRIYGTIDKDKIVEETEKTTKMVDRKYLLEMKPEARLDLHGMRQEEARQQLNYFIGECVKKGIRKVIVIHGKGIHTTGADPVLGELVRKFIESDSRCGTSGHPKLKSEGGSGATWIILKY